MDRGTAVAGAMARYQDNGSAIRVEVHSGWVRIVSPGSMLEPVTVENIRFQQAARNRSVLEVLRRLGLAEDLGRDIDRIEDDMVADLLQPAEFDDDGSLFPGDAPAGWRSDAARAGVGPTIDRSRPPGCTVGTGGGAGGATRVDHQRSGAVPAGLGVDSVVARNILQRLDAEGVFAQEGERDGAQYALAESTGVPVRIRCSEEELEKIVLAMAAQAPITNSLVCERTGLDRPAALASSSG